MKFEDLKVGDELECIDVSISNLVNKGDVVKISWIDEAGFRIEGDDGYWHIDWLRSFKKKDSNLRDESDHIALIENRGGGGQYEEVMTCHAQIMKSFKDKHISDVRLATMSMIAHKIARLVCGYGDDDDNLKDIAGYAELERKTLKGELK